jgi:Ca-activated chloride channel family protein
MDQLMEPAAIAPASTEAFANTPEHPVQITAENPVSTFSVDVDTASWAVIRSSLNAGLLPPPDAVRVEEMINYFPYAYAPPSDTDLPFRPGIAVMETPWNAQTRLVRIALQGRMPALADRPPLNLVFLVDTSGSMNEPAKLPLLKRSLGLMLGQLRPEDQIAIVAYAGSAGEVLPPTPAGDRSTILSALDRLDAGGATAGAEGLELAYQVAAGMAAPGEVSRVLLATDGDFNLGLADPAELAPLVARKRTDGTYLSVLGFGRGNLDDATMQALAQNGNGTASYIDTLQEAQKVLVDQLAGALFPIADDVKIQVEWNPAEVAEYRLIGYETRALRREDFNNDAVDAGEIGAGHQVTALYEITAPGSPAQLNDPLRYGARTGGEAVPATAGAELGFLRLRFKTPSGPTGDGEESTLVETPITANAGPDADARFAAAIAGFGQLLRGSGYLGSWGWDDAIALAQETGAMIPLAIATRLSR